MDAKSKPTNLFNWKIAFFIMCGLFIALLFYTVILTVQFKAGALYLAKKIKMMQMSKEMPLTNISVTPTAVSATATQFKGKYFEIMVPAYWTIEAYASPQNTSLEAYSLVNTKSEPVKQNGSGTVPKERIFLRIIDKKSITLPVYENGVEVRKETKVFPTQLKDRVSFFTGFDMSAPDTIMVNGKSIPVGFGGGEGTFGWYTFIENDNYVAAFQSQESDSKDKTKLFPGVGVQNEIISSLKFTN